MFTRSLRVPSSLSVRLSAGLLAGLLAFGLACTAAAQGVQLNRFSAANAPEDMFQTESPVARGHDFWAAQAVIDYAASPLLFTAAGATETTPVVEHQLTLHATLSYSLFDRLLLYGALPMHLLMTGQDVLGVPGADESTLSDPTLGARVRLIGDPQGPFGLALAADVTFPFAQASLPEQNYSGDQSVNFVPKVLFEFRPTRLRVTANVGMRLREEYTSNAGALVRSELLWRAGVGFEVLGGDDELEAIVEASGNHALDSFARDSTTNIEMLLGLKYLAKGGLTAGVAAGPGLSAGWGTPAARVMVSIGFIQPEPEPEPEPVEDPGPVDTDGDGYPDDEDNCPDGAEDLDEFEDEDGCPDPDNDGDGVPDPDDQCPNDAEDLDEFEDEDGCPDPDNDRDEILDADDGCPNDAEDRDGFADADGCPDLDNDADGVLDEEDPCPLAVGTPAGGGCPTSHRLEEGQLRLLSGISFAPRGATFVEGTEEVLEEVRATLAANPQIRRVRVDAHTDDRGSDARNLTLSRQRALAVVTWMTEHGLEASRFEAWGCGETRPVAEGTSRQARAQNARIEFHVVDPEAEGTPSTEACELSVEAPAEPR
ncbi:MAG: OmpA family protein [Deltaproteobacteria bacterium]|nr:OmpA family protein [Deltaproteobacteria bacterium]